MTNLRLSSNGALSNVTVLLLWLCLACDAFPIVSLVDNDKPTFRKVVDPPQAKKDSLLPLLLKLRPPRHNFMVVKPNIENGQQEIGLRRIIRSTDDYIYDDDSNNPHDNYIYTTPGSGEDDSYVYTTTADPWS